MHWEEYVIVFIKREVTDIYLVRLKPKKSKHTIFFTPGQFFHMKNPTFGNPDETHPFSATTTTKNTTYIEFCMKVHGSWTQAFIRKKSGETVWLYGPMGCFTLHQITSYPIFIAGGVGITPILSMVRSLYEEDSAHPVTLLYATKSPKTIVKRKTIEALFSQKKHWKLIFIFSKEFEEIQQDKIKNYKGHITGEILGKEVSLIKNPIFFVCGAPMFITTIITLLHTFSVNPSNIKREIFSI